MLRTSETTNGFRFSEGLINNNRTYGVVQLNGGSFYAVDLRTVRRVAKQRGAFGFWRVKR